MYCQLAALAALALVFALCAARDGAESAAMNSVETVFVTGADTGRFTSMELTASGLPVVSFSVAGIDSTNILSCGNSTCTPQSQLVHLDAVPGISRSLAQADGLAWLAFFNSEDGDLGLLRCVNPACTGSIPVYIDTAGSVGSDSSIELDSQGLPVISYRDFTNGNLKVAHCVSVVCSSGTSLTSPDTAGNSDRPPRWSWTRRDIPWSAISTPATPL